MLKHLLLLPLYLSLSACSEGDTSLPLAKDAFYLNSLLGKGVNLGNALDAPEEGAWGVTLEEQYFERIAAAGFDSIRIPIRWSAHAKLDPPYTIDPAFLERVDWAIEQTVSRGMVAVINLHHYEEITADPSEHRERFLGLWKQLSAHYAGFPETLYFELLNEPHSALTNKIWNEMLREGLSVVRAKHPDRAVIIGPTHWNNLIELKHLDLPEDDQHLIVTFHYYTPFSFTHQGASWVGEQSQKWLGTTWEGTETEKESIRMNLDAAMVWAKEHHRPLYMGEFGAYQQADMASRERWTSFVRAEAERRNISWAYWEFCAEGFGVYDPKKQEWRQKLLRALLPEVRSP